MKNFKKIISLLEFENYNKLPVFEDIVDTENEEDEQQDRDKILDEVLESLFGGPETNENKDLLDKKNKMFHNPNQTYDITLEEYLNGIIPENYTTCWYPSSNTDFSIIHELERSDIKPDLFVFSDYALRIFDMDISVGATLRNEFTNNEIIECHKLKLKSQCDFSVNESYVDFPEAASDEIYLLKVALYHNVNNTPLGEHFVIYFNYENINFLDEILLKNKVKIDFFIKTNEGFAWGGGRKSIKGVYGLFSELQVNTILTDKLHLFNEDDIELYEKLSKKHNLQPKHYSIKGIPRRTHTDRGTIYNLIYIDDAFDSQKLINQKKI